MWGIKLVLNWNEKWCTVWNNPSQSSIGYCLDRIFCWIFLVISFILLIPNVDLCIDLLTHKSVSNLIYSGNLSQSAAAYICFGFPILVWKVFPTSVIDYQTSKSVWIVCNYIADTEEVCFLFLPPQLLQTMYPF
jgi:hypothetical protein